MRLKTKNPLRGVFVLRVEKARKEYWHEDGEHEHERAEHVAHQVKYEIDERVMVLVLAAVDLDVADGVGGGHRCVKKIILRCSRRTIRHIGSRRGRAWRSLMMFLDRCNALALV